MAKRNRYYEDEKITYKFNSSINKRSNIINHKKYITCKEKTSSLTKIKHKKNIT